MTSEFSKFSFELINIINSTGKEARFVGGCVRDSLIGRPFTDIDIATNMLPNDTESLLKKNGIKTFPTGIKHGTITAVKNHESIEITTLRQDINCNGRHAEIEFTDKWQEDAARRDFTFNAIYIDADGKLYDYFNGIDDINSGIIRFIKDPDERIKEDYLRILRFFRFSAHYSKDINNMDNDVLSIISDNASGLDKISAERIKIELFKLIMSEQSPIILNYMERCNVINRVLPIDHFRIQNLYNLISLDNNVNYLTRLACLISEKPHNNIIIADKYLALSNTEKKYLKNILEPKCEITFDMSVSEQKSAIRLLGAKEYKNILLLLASDPDIFNGSNIRDKLRKLLSFADNWIVPRFPLKGVDLLKIGLNEGKEIGDLLKKAEDYWETKEYNMTKDELLEYLGIETCT